MGLVVVNFSHPLTDEHIQQIEGFVGSTVDRVIPVSSQVDLNEPMAPQAVRLVDQVGLTGEEWQTLPIVVQLPGMAPLAACVLAELAGRMGYLPAILRMAQIPGSTPPRWRVEEVIDLQFLRNNARARRHG